jgi:hypothetical protein
MFHHAEIARRERSGHPPTGVVGSLTRPRGTPAPVALRACCFAQFVFDFDTVKALLGDDRSFALEILVRTTCHRFPLHPPLRHCASAD